MDIQRLFEFKTDISELSIPKDFNNPFAVTIPDIAKIAAREFQDFIALESEAWKYDFRTQKGKMFGVLVVQDSDGSYKYLGSNSGKLLMGDQCDRFVPSVFDLAVGGYFINSGMTRLTEMSREIRMSDSASEILVLKEERRLSSIALQQRLFENYNFLNLSGEERNLLEIFERSTGGLPPSAAGECAAPKLLHYAIEHGLRPVALTEFWWGSPTKERKSNAFYPACKSRCRPILEYMLEDTDLFHRRLKVSV